MQSSLSDAPASTGEAPAWRHVLTANPVLVELACVVVNIKPTWHWPTYWHKWRLIESRLYEAVRDPAECEAARTVLLSVYRHLARRAAA